jgi:hypothetical protein
MRRKFTEHEDQQLRELVAEMGNENWPLIANSIPGRTARQCKERWTHYLAPGIVFSEWAPDEDQLLEAKVAESGEKWKTLERYFIGRTDANIKNRYNVLKRRRRRQVWARAALRDAPAVADDIMGGFHFDEYEESFDWFEPYPLD